VDGGHPTIDTFLIRPNAYPANYLSGQDFGKRLPNMAG